MSASAERRVDDVVSGFRAEIRKDFVQEHRDVAAGHTYTPSEPRRSAMSPESFSVLAL